MKSELFVQRESTAMRPDIIGPPQVDGAEERDNLPVTHGVKVLVGPMSINGQQVRQLVIQELLDERGGVLLNGGPQHGLEPGRIELLLAERLLSGDIQELRDFSAEGILYSLGFFLLSASSRMAACSITANNSSKMS